MRHTTSKLQEPIVLDPEFAAELDDLTGPLIQHNVSINELDQVITETVLMNSGADEEDDSANLDDLQAHLDSIIGSSSSATMATSRRKSTQPKRARPLKFKKEKATGSKKTATMPRQKPLQCTKCHDRFCSPCELREHMNKHTGAKPFECAVCGKAFAMRASLWNHCRTHIDHLPFKCPFCESNFKWKNCLYIHWRMHLRQDPSLIDKLDTWLDTVEGLSFVRGRNAVGKNAEKAKMTSVRMKEKIISRVLKSLEHEEARSLEKLNKMAHKIFQEDADKVLVEEIKDEEIEDEN